MVFQKYKTLILLELFSIGHGSGSAAAWRGHRDASAAAHLILSGGDRNIGQIE